MPAPRSSSLILAAIVGLLVACCGAFVGGAPPPSPSATPAATTARSAMPPASSGAALVSDPALLAGRTFLSTTIAGRDLVAGSQARLTFGSTLGASAGCNSMSGPFTIADGTLGVARMTTTEMACDAPLMDQDLWLARFLDGAAISFDGTTLTLTADGTTLTLVDEQVANPDRPLEGTTWVVESLVRDQAVSNVPTGLAATLAFADGRVEAGTGCNRGGGSATVADGAITFGPLALTRMACPQPAMDLEGFVVGVLQGEVAYTIDGDVLHLLGAGGGLDLHAEP
jgi:heat shock protein HslJ